MVGGTTPGDETRSRVRGAIPHGGPGLRVAIVGAGPAGFFAAAALLKEGAQVDLYERLPAPFGLVRYGVAPDHQKIKRVASAFDKIARSPGLRYFGNVEVGRDVGLEELRAHYDQVLVTIGAASDRRLGVPGEDLAGSVSAVSVVGWYNGHPDFPSAPPLDGRRAVVVGLGNVALDVARVLIRHPRELEPTDIDDDALLALRRSKVREVVLLGRRGPVEAAFDLGELQDLTRLVGVEVGVDAAPGELEAALTGAELDSATAAKVAFIAGLPRADALTGHRRVLLRFLASPRELRGDAEGRVRQLEIEHNELQGPPGAARARGTGRTSTLAADLVIRAIGYRAVPLPELPFDAARAVVPNEGGRVLRDDGEVEPGLYVAGWIKRGPTGLIGTNKGCALQTVQAMLEDAARGSFVREGGPGAIDELLAARGVRVVDYDDWLRIDAAELEAGRARGRARVKTRSTEELLEWLETPPRTSQRAAR